MFSFFLQPSRPNGAVRRPYAQTNGYGATLRFVLVPSEPEAEQRRAALTASTLKPRTTERPAFGRPVVRAFLAVLPPAPSTLRFSAPPQPKLSEPGSDQRERCNPSRAVARTRSARRRR